MGRRIYIQVGRWASLLMWQRAGDAEKSCQWLEQWRPSLHEQRGLIFNSTPSSAGLHCGVTCRPTGLLLTVSPSVDVARYKCEVLLRSGESGQRWLYSVIWRNIMSVWELLNVGEADN